MATFKANFSSYSHYSTSYRFSIGSDIANAYNPYTNINSYGTLTHSYSNGANNNIFMNFDTSDLPDNAVITGIAVNVAIKLSNTSNYSASGLYLCNGDNSSTTYLTSSSTTYKSTSRTVYTLTANQNIPTSKSDINKLCVRIHLKKSASSTTRIYIYGGTISITYTIPTVNKLRLGDSTPSKIYMGDTLITKMYLGDTLIYDT